MRIRSCRTQTTTCKTWSTCRQLLSTLPGDDDNVDVDDDDDDNFEDDNDDDNNDNNDDNDDDGDEMVKFAMAMAMAMAMSMVMRMTMGMTMAMTITTNDNEFKSQAKHQKRAGVGARPKINQVYVTKTLCILVILNIITTTMRIMIPQQGLANWGWSGRRTCQARADVQSWPRQ